MEKEKDYVVNVTLKFTQAISATSEQDAKDRTRETFKDEYNLDPDDDEMEVVI